jgi:hypothetical protein
MGQLLDLQCCYMIPLQVSSGLKSALWSSCLLLFNESAGSFMSELDARPQEEREHDFCIVVAGTMATGPSDLCVLSSDAEGGGLPTASSQSQQEIHSHSTSSPLFRGKLIARLNAAAENVVTRMSSSRSHAQSRLLVVASNDGSVRAFQLVLGAAKNSSLYSHSLQLIWRVAAVKCHVKQWITLPMSHMHPAV